jgi:hypothetical protein
MCSYYGAWPIFFKMNKDLLIKLKVVILSMQYELIRIERIAPIGGLSWKIKLKGPTTFCLCINWPYNNGSELCEHMHNPSKNRRT